MPPDAGCTSNPQVEIDEYRDYEKALGALNEAWKQLAKAGPQAEKLAQLKQKIFLVERYAPPPIKIKVKTHFSGSSSDRGHHGSLPIYIGSESGVSSVRGGRCKVRNVEASDSTASDLGGFARRGRSRACLGVACYALQQCKS